jgi:selenide,water dikinase
VLRPVKEVFESQDAPDLLVGLGAADDAALWRLDDSRALVVTTDFFTPVVDDAYDYGAIAAANSLSDVYAMGGRPFLALNVAALPPDLPPEVGAEILRGGAEKAREAGVVIAGGHTVQDKEPKYGLVALGFVEPARAFTKGGVRAGDALVLTKPLGFGVTTTALKQETARPEDVAEAVEWMKRLNDRAADLGLEFGLRGATDVTGFGLLGHGLEVAEASGVGLRIDYPAVPFLSGAAAYARAFTFPGGAYDNRRFFGGEVRFIGDFEEWERMLLFDPQTSGGLLLAVPGERLEELRARAEALGQPAWVIGEAVEGAGIEVRRG